MHFIPSSLLVGTRVRRDTFSTGHHSPGCNDRRNKDLLKKETGVGSGEDWESDAQTSSKTARGTGKSAKLSTSCSTILVLVGPRQGVYPEDYYLMMKAGLQREADLAAFMRT